LFNFGNKDKRKGPEAKSAGELAAISNFFSPMMEQRGALTFVRLYEKPKSCAKLLICGAKTMRVYGVNYSLTDLCNENISYRFWATVNQHPHQCTIKDG
jgi:hypothetical protein